MRQVSPLAEDNKTVRWEHGQTSTRQIHSGRFSALSADTLRDKSRRRVTVADGYRLALDIECDRTHITDPCYAC